MDKISIIVPVYNASKYLKTTLDSIVSQTYKEWETILVDDGSSDGSAEICDEYANHDARFIVIHKENSGVSSARNLGITKANGNYICFLDSDDLMRPYLLQGCLESIGTSDLLIFGFKRFNYRNDICVPDSAKIVGNYSCQQFLYRLKEDPSTSEFFCFPWNKMYKTSLLVDNKVEFPTDISLREDEIFAYKYLPYIEGLTVVPDIYVDYNDGSTGLSAKRLSPDSSIALARHLLAQANAVDNERSKSVLFFRAMIYMQDAINNSSSYGRKRAISKEMIIELANMNFTNVSLNNIGKRNYFMIKTLQLKSVSLVILYAYIIHAYRLFRIYILRDKNLKRWGVNV